MAELSSLHVKITGDSSSAQAAIREPIALLNQYGQAISYVKTQEAQMFANAKRGWSHMGKSIETFNKEARVSRFHSANLFAQFQDIGVMMMSGQSPFILAAQQGSQISQVLMQMGGTAKSQFAALRDAAKMFIAPTQILTIAVIAAAAALVQWGIKAAGAEDNLSDLEEQVKALTEEITKGKDEIRQFNLGLSSTAQLRIFDQLREAQTELNRLEARRAAAIESGSQSARRQLRSINAQIKAQADHVKELQDLLNEAQKVEEVQERTTEGAKELAEAERLLGEQMQQVARDAAVLRVETEKARDAAMEAAREWTIMQGLRSRFRGEDALMGMEVAIDPSNLDPDKYNNKKKGREDPLKGELEQLQESLMTELELEKHMHDEKQAVLEEALKKRYLTEVQFKELEAKLHEEHAKRLAEIDVWRHGTALQQTGAFMGQMAAAMMTGNEKMLQIAKVFGAGEALINAWRTYSQVMADPNLPWFAKIPTAVSLLGSAMQAVNAIKGVGKGGSGQKSVSGGGGGGGASSGGGQSSRVALTLIGSENATFSRTQIRDLINQINQATEDGAIVRLT